MGDMPPPDPFQAIGDLQHRVKYLEQCYNALVQTYNELVEDYDALHNRLRAVERTIPRKRPPKRPGTVAGPVRR